MADEVIITASELGAYTNNISNKEGIKKVVKAINDGLSPDLSAYQKKLTAGDNITITDEDVISATVPPTLTALSPIEITANDEINLKGFSAPDSNADWEKYATGWPYVLNKDILLVINYDQHSIIYLPKGYKFSNDYIVCDVYQTRIAKLYFRDIFKNGSSLDKNNSSCTIRDFSTSETNGVITYIDNTDYIGISRYAGEPSGSSTQKISIGMFVRW